MKKGDVGMAKCFSKKYGNKGRTLTTCNLKVMLCYIPITLPQEEAAKTYMLSW